MIKTTYVPKQIQNVKNEETDPITFSPTRRKTVIAPRLIKLFNNNARYSV